MVSLAIRSFPSSPQLADMNKVNECFRFWIALEDPLWQDYYSITRTPQRLCSVKSIEVDRPILPPREIIHQQVETPLKERVEIRDWSHLKNGCCKGEPESNNKEYLVRKPALPPRPPLELPTPIEIAFEKPREPVEHFRFLTSPAEHIEFADQPVQIITPPEDYSKRAWAKNSLRNMKGSLRRRPRVTIPREPVQGLENDHAGWLHKKLDSAKSTIRRKSSINSSIESVKSLRRRLLGSSSETPRRKSISTTFSFE